MTSRRRGEGFGVMPRDHDGVRAGVVLAELLVMRVVSPCGLPRVAQGACPTQVGHALAGCGVEEPAAVGAFRGDLTPGLSAGAAQCMGWCRPVKPPVRRFLAREWRGAPTATQFARQKPSAKTAI